MPVRIWSHSQSSFVMNSKEQGNLGESEVVYRLLKQGFEIYLPFLDSGRYDFILNDPSTDKIKKVEVKTTRSLRSNGDSYEVQLCGRTHKGGYKFFGELKSPDLLAVFVIPENKIVFFDVKRIKSKYKLLISKNKIQNNEYCENINEILNPALV